MPAHRNVHYPNGFKAGFGIFIVELPPDPPAESAGASAPPGAPEIAPEAARERVAASGPLAPEEIAGLGERERSDYLRLMVFVLENYHRSDVRRFDAHREVLRHQVLACVHQARADALLGPAAPERERYAGTFVVRTGLGRLFITGEAVARQAAAVKAERSEPR
jgi:hypothetical protein